jgi:hypothetical protein
MSSNRLFSIVDKEIVVVDLAIGHVVWPGRPIGRDVVDLVQVDDQDRAVVLLESFGSPPGERANLLALNAHGRVLWRAKLPTSDPTDPFTSIELRDETVIAFTWSCHTVAIDLDDGCTLGVTFTK